MISLQQNVRYILGNQAVYEKLLGQH